MDHPRPMDRFQPVEYWKKEATQFQITQGLLTREHRTQALAPLVIMIM